MLSAPDVWEHKTKGKSMEKYFFFSNKKIANQLFGGGMNLRL